MPETIPAIRVALNNSKGVIKKQNNTILRLKFYVRKFRNDLKRLEDDLQKLEINAEKYRTSLEEQIALVKVQNECISELDDNLLHMKQMLKDNNLDFGTCTECGWITYRHALYHRKYCDKCAF
jgi:hypothetical protein